MSRSKRFRTKRIWYNTRAWFYVGAVILLTGLVLAPATGKMLYPVTAGIIFVMGLAAAVYRDRLRGCTYAVDEQGLHLQDARGTLDIAKEEILDASLIDRIAARDYIVQLNRSSAERGGGEAETRERARSYVRFCTVDIGLRTFTFGLGRRLIDRMPNAKNDLVLLRLRHERAFLLSPVYNLDLITALGRFLHEGDHRRERA